MVHRAVLIFPVDTTDVSLDRPRYGEVISRRGGVGQIRILPRSDDEVEVTATVSLSTTSSRRVPRSELVSGQPGLLLFQPVYYTREGTLRHGQVTAYHDGMYDVRTESGIDQVPFVDTVEIAPVLALLLWKVEFESHILSISELATAHDQILDRLFGQNGHRATKQIPRLLSGIVARRSMPRTTDKVPWMCPKSGVEKLLYIGDVVNFAFYKNGGRTPPNDMYLGDTFSDRPFSTALPDQQIGRPSDRIIRGSRSTTNSINSGGGGPSTLPDRRNQPRRRRQDLQQASSNETSEVSDNEENVDATTRFSDLLEVLTNDTPVPKRRRVAGATVDPSSSVTQTVHHSPIPATTAHDRSQAILQVLSSHPDLKAAYTLQLEQLAASALARGAVGRQDSEPSITSPTQQLPQLPGISDLAPATSHHSKNLQSFRPSRAQLEVHNAITSPSYIGKDADIFMDHSRTSDATKFLAHPAITSRLYDFQFGVCELSILHFPRFDLHSQLNRTRAKTINMKKFSPKVELPDLPSHPTYGDLTECLAVLNSFAKAFLNIETCDLVAAAKDFVEQLDDFSPWSSSEVHILAFWCSNVFGAYRRAVVHDIRTGESTRTLVKFRFHMQDIELSGLLFKAARSRQQQSSRPVNGDPNTTSLRVVPRQEALFGSMSTQSGPGKRRRDKKVPEEVSAQVPRKSGRQLCLRYASIQGCPSKTKDRCIQNYLAHFEPSSIPAIVENYIRDHYGGVRIPPSNQ